jgi:hypothetical protein
VNPVLQVLKVNLAHRAKPVPQALKANPAHKVNPAVPS